MTVRPAARDPDDDRIPAHHADARWKVSCWACSAGQCGSPVRRRPASHPREVLESGRGAAHRSHARTRGDRHPAADLDHSLIHCVVIGDAVDHLVVRSAVGYGRLPEGARVGARLLDAAQRQPGGSPAGHRRDRRRRAVRARTPGRVPLDPRLPGWEGRRRRRLRAAVRHRAGRPVLAHVRVSITPTDITFLVDGVVVATAPQVAGGRAPMFLLLDLALGDGWPVDLHGGQERARLFLDYVRVYV